MDEDQSMLGDKSFEESNMVGGHALSEMADRG